MTLKKPSRPNRCRDSHKSGKKPVTVQPKGASALTEAINKALSELSADGSLSKISEKYFVTDVSK
ncbi:transporter substrate-binding domain-containing protein [Renibacterium salmoninarum]|uniref:transporter substrate-binding domain-containing protein n=1 Tax=Renibacterium salmoninarum TaxID=1646 RepID=UPI0009B5A7BB